MLYIAHKFLNLVIFLDIPYAYFVCESDIATASLLHVHCTLGTSNLYITARALQVHLAFTLLKVHFRYTSPIHYCTCTSSTARLYITARALQVHLTYTLLHMHFRYTSTIHYCTCTSGTSRLYITARALQVHLAYTLLHVHFRYTSPIHYCTCTSSTSRLYITARALYIYTTFLDDILSGVISDSNLYSCVTKVIFSVKITFSHRLFKGKVE